MSVNQNSKFFARPSGDISYTPTSGGSPSISSDSEELREILTTKGDLFVYTGTAVSRQAVGADNKPLVADSAQTNGVRYGGKILVDEAEIDAALNHDGSTAGFFGVTPASRAAALTQTYSTADRTLSAYTADDESAAYTGVDNAQVGTVYATVADLNALRTAYENLRALAEDTTQFLNALIDDLQAYGLEQ